jgi:hypothetical protein
MSDPLGQYFAAEKQAAVLCLALGATAARAAELARMERVNRSFKWVEVLEAVLIVGALVMVFAFRERPSVTAIGLGLLVQAAMMLAFDVFAEHRAHAYTSWLRD